MFFLCFSVFSYGGWLVFFIFEGEGERLKMFRLSDFCVIVLDKILFSGLYVYIELIRF